MSSDASWRHICHTEQAIAFDPARLCAELPTASVSPIDDFYRFLSSMIPLGDSAALQANDVLGKVLLLGLVSATEHYFRAVLAGLVRVCPETKRAASSMKLSFGALQYYPAEDLGFALIEHASLATAGEVRKQTQSLAGFDVSHQPSIAAALKQYDLLCQFRHAAVHARGDLGHQNLSELGITLATKNRLVLQVDFATLHACASICQNVVRAYNRHLYTKTIERWIAKRILLGDWPQDRPIFRALHELFHSKTDAIGAKNSYLAYLRLRGVVRNAILQATS